MPNYDEMIESPGNVMRRLHEHDMALQELAAARTLENAAVGAGGLLIHDGGGITIEDGGGITVTDGGGLTITDDGVLNLADASVKNEALANPVFPAVVSNAAQGFSVPGKANPASRVSASIAVPAGFTRAMCFATGDAFAQNTTASTDYIGCNADIEGDTDEGKYSLGHAGPDQFAYSSSAQTALLTGLSGGQITFSTRIFGEFSAWSASPSNTVNIDAMVLFLR